MTDRVNRILEFDQVYEIDNAYAAADRYAVGSDKWHRWMDRAKDLRIAREVINSEDE